jgi:ComF family protein
MHRPKFSKSGINKLVHNLADLFFPKFCLGCYEEGSFICAKCLKKLKLQELCCPVCDKVNFVGLPCLSHRRQSKLDGLLFAVRFQGLAKVVVHSFKYEGIKDLAEPISKLMAEILVELPLFKYKEKLILVPAPLFFAKRWQRGFNQAEILAQKIGKSLNLPTENLVLRIRPTASQTKFEKQARQKNIQAAFALSQKGKITNLKDKIVVIVDDVYTTGSTINEIAKTLKPKKPKAIWGLVFAKD